MKRVYNFNPGPATLPLEVLKEAQAEFLNFDETGMSIIEISHRSKAYERVHNQAKADILELMGLGDDYEVLFIQGGASLQFAMIPLNFATKKNPGSYVLSGTFSSNAYKEAQILGVGEIAASTKDENFKRVPRQDELKINPNAAYLHVCYNNTIYGTEFHYVPETGNVPLFADMSSDMLSRTPASKKIWGRPASSSSWRVKVSSKKVWTRSRLCSATILFIKRIRCTTRRPRLAFTLLAKSRRGLKIAAVLTKWRGATRLKRNSFTTRLTVPTAFIAGTPKKIHAR